ncbi:late expression factor 11 [Ectropis obliqua nucleopolyhedrovirus]|uniref:Late expression factor 11 n=1 Tax=Ectropis obliqua nucleopolyhedrovirus TaxID=59376 RepID=A0EYS8_9ABAC|nr:late expression factor 11 [Ectropis obliqua nucleopolyhedrovirus]ABI35709.1 late expression factor 11 [Ectropis obliqua nucleopolyhedrovirus]QWV59611.1 late expression factor 11 [Ectropis obliqua nucleopolyhedrovirus]UYO72817.1 late expression factor 11 [Ectropis obliqua nucleopolyhedrovirus]
MEYETSQNCDGHSARTIEHSQCLTRSEVYALLREVINKRKHENDHEGVCDHINSIDFQAQLDYIRQNIEKAYAIVGDGGVNTFKSFAPHLMKLENIFNLQSTLEGEYHYCTVVRNKRHNKN